MLNKVNKQQNALVKYFKFFLYYNNTIAVDILFNNILKKYS